MCDPATTPVTHRMGANITPCRAPEPTPPPVAIRPSVPGYTLGRELGRGGMGAVYEADQHDPPRRVALKLIARDALDPDAAARFAVERQAIARMDHPHVARVFDTGLTTAGVPYFAMELVNGPTLTAYCRDKAMGVRGRLTLFAGVCRAVQHAHQKGVVHRDLKPGNILVAEVDGQPVPKVIDFGVAKLVGEAGGGASVTRFGLLAGTPLYMAPEQANPFAHIDTRADVYALGVVLFELLTGTTPLDPAELDALTPTEVLQRVSGQTPVKPSTAARGRPTPPAVRTVAVPAELDWVVLKCLAHDPGERYATVEQVAADVERYLRDEPVSAGPPSRWYAASKFVKRHRGPVAAAAVMLALLFAGVVGTAAGLVQADAQRQVAEQRFDEAEQARLREAEQRTQADANAARATEAEADTAAFLHFMSHHVFAAARPKDVEGGLGKDVTLRAALSAAEPHLDREFQGRPLAEALARLEIGRTWYQLGDAKRAMGYLTRAVELRTQHLGEDHDDTLQALNHLAILAQDVGQFERATEAFAALVAKFEAKQGPNHIETLTARVNRARCDWAAGRHDDAIRQFVPTLVALEAHHGIDHRATLITRNNLAAAYQSAGRYSEAVDAFTLVERGFAQAGMADHPDADNARSNRAGALQKLNRHAEAVDVLEPIVTRWAERFGDSHPNTLRMRSNLASSYHALGDVRRAISLFEQNHLAYRSAGSERTPSALTNANNLAVTFATVGDFARAIPLHESTLDGRRKVLGDTHLETLTSANNLGHALWKSGDPAAALKHLQWSFDGARQALGPDHPNTLITQTNLARVHLDLGQLAVARDLCDDLRERSGRVHPKDHPHRFEAERGWIDCREALGEWAVAAEARAALLDIERKQVPPDHPVLGSILVRLGLAQLKCNRYVDAETTLREALTIREKKEPNVWTTAYVRSLLGEALLGQKKSADAEPLLRAGYEGLKEKAATIPAPRRRERLEEALERLIRLATETGQPDAVKKWEAEWATLPREQLPPPRKAAR